MTATVKTRPEAETVSMSQIRPSKTNPRKHFDHVELAEMAESVKVYGILQPILIRPQGDEYELVAGERRYRAASLAGLRDIPAKVRDLDDLETLEVQVIENDHRADLNAIEKAYGYRAILDMGRKVEELAAKIGRKTPTVYGFLKLLELPEEAKKAIEAGELHVQTAIVIARIPNLQHRVEATKEVLKDRLSLKQTMKLVRNRYMLSLKRAPFDRRELNLLPMVPSCDTCPKQIGNNRIEFPEGRGDVCTDPACYQAKCNAAAAKGQPAEEEIPLAEVLPDDGPAAAEPTPPASRPQDPFKEAETLVKRLRKLHEKHPSRVPLDLILDQYGQVLLATGAK